MNNITFFVLTLLGSHESSRRFRRLNNTIFHLACRDSFPLKKVQVRFGDRLGSVLQIMDQAQNYQAVHGGMVGILEDDAELHPDFCTELAKTLADLPPLWEVLHLCPGFAWGRQFRDHESRPVEFRPERRFRARGLTARVWDGPPDREAWLGGPEAYIVKSQSFWQPVMDHMRRGMGTTDIDLTLSAFKKPGLHFVARNPPLCKEADLGFSVRQNRRVP